MNLYEFEGKKLFKEAGIPVPESTLITSADVAVPFDFPFVVKAQTMTGGRGKAGGVRMCHNEDEFRKNASEIIDMKIKGHPVCGLLCEKAVNLQKELYVSFTIQGVQRPTMIFSAAGGMDIEEVAVKAPDKLKKVEIDPFIGLMDYQLKEICMLVPEADTKELSAFLRKLYRLFCDKQAKLVEINPLGISDGHLIALDSKVVLDDHSRASAQDCLNIETERSKLVNYEVPYKETTTITYIPLDGGNIGLISDGAGTGMLTLDLITENGGKLGSFCELGGTTPAEVMYRAMQYTLERKQGIKAIIVVLIGGFNRMDDMANGITGYLKDHKVDVPIFTRMCGTMEEEGKKIMADAGLKTYSNLTDTVKLLIEAANKEA